MHLVLCQIAGGGGGRTRKLSLEKACGMSVALEAQGSGVRAWRLEAAAKVLAFYGVGMSAFLDTKGRET